MREPRRERVAGVYILCVLAISTGFQQRMKRLEGRISAPRALDG